LLPAFWPEPRASRSRRLFWNVTPSPNTSSRAPRRKFRFLSIVKWFAIVLASGWAFAALLLVAARWIDPPTTAVHVQRRVQAWIHNKPYQKRYHFVPLSQMSANFPHAAVSAEDGRFYQHHGFDWHAIQLAAQEDMDGDRMRGGSTITQQLVKNLFFGTSRSILRKAAEASLVPVAELVLGKRRILELYLNVVEWGPGIYGVDAACRTYYKVPPRNISRQQAAELAAMLPAPLKRHPGMTHYTQVILRRMGQTGW
jgi:monofunctional glycosyltransferase